MQIVKILMAVLLIASGCETDKLSSSDQNIIISLIIYELAIPVPPPPPPPDNIDSLEEGEKMRLMAHLDSLLQEAKNRKIEIALDSTLFRYGEEISLQNSDFKEEYGPLVKEFRNQNAEVIQNWNYVGKDGHNVTLVKKEMLDVEDEQENLISVSTIIFNGASDKAVAIGVRNLGILNSSATLFFLQKVDGQWHIANKDVLSYS